MPDPLHVLFSLGDRLSPDRVTAKLKTFHVRAPAYGDGRKLYLNIGYAATRWRRIISEDQVRLGG